MNLDESSISDAIKKSIPGKSWFKCRPVSIGAFPGQNTMPNQNFESLVDTNDAWIAKRTGIRKRHLIREGTSLRTLAIESAKRALERGNINPLDIDLIIVATSSPDDLFGDAASIAYQIGATNAAGFDVTAACSGFVYGMITAAQFLQAGSAKKALVIGGDALTRFMDWKDRGTCILFGDGAGAMILEATDRVEDSGLLGFAIKSDGSGYCNLNLPFQSNFQALDNNEKTVVDQGSYGKMYMNGQEVYKFAVNRVRLLLFVVIFTFYHPSSLFFYSGS